MLLVVVLVFLGVFGVIVLLMLASNVGGSRQSKQALTALQSALATDKLQGRDQIVDIRKKELLSAIPLLNRWLLKIELAPRLHRLLYQANLKWTAGGLILMSAACFLIPTYLMYRRSGVLIFSLVVGVLLGTAPFAFVLFKRSQRFKKFEQNLPEALDLMVSALRAGHSLIAALGLVSRECVDPIGSEFRICFEEQNYGLELRTAMDNLVARVPLQDLKLVSTAILIQKESGGNLAEVLDKVSQLVRDRFRLKRQILVHTAQGRMTGWVLTFLPVVLGLAMWMVNPKTMSLLWTDPLGLKLMYVAAAMIVVGGLIIRQIVNMEV
jgi:tight adherence protein B